MHKILKPCDLKINIQQKMSVKQSVRRENVECLRGNGTCSSCLSENKSPDIQSVRDGDFESNIYKSSEEYFEDSCFSCQLSNGFVDGQIREKSLCRRCFRVHCKGTPTEYHPLLDNDVIPRKSSRNCEPCIAVIGDETEAVGYCKNCEEYLCDGCYKSHLRRKSFKDHVLLHNLSEESHHKIAASIDKLDINNRDSRIMKNTEEYTYFQEFSSKASTDENRCYITGMASVSDTELILCDYHNYCLKLIGTDSRIIKDVLILQTLPNGITAVSKDQVAIVLNKTYKIQFISTSGGLSVVRTIRTTGSCLDVKYSNGKLFVSFWEPVKFQVLAMTGAIIKTINPDSEVIKHCILPRYIALSLDESTIYVSDWRTNKVLSLDMNGNMVSLYNGELDKPYDITVSPFGSVYLCNRDQNIVYKMASDLSEASVMLGPGDGLQYPHAMCFDTDKQHLYISSGHVGASSANVIKMYKLA